jgi:hypothetical protein
MQKARQSLLQIGLFVLCFNGVWWFISNMRDGPPTFGQLVFRVAVFVLGLFLVGAAGLLALIARIQTPPESDIGSRSTVIRESDLIDEDVAGKEEQTE